jgi:membrane protein
MLSIFPALLAVVSLLGVFGQSATEPLLESLGPMAPGPARQILEQVLLALQENRQAAGVAMVIGIAVALWSASGYVGAFIRAANVMYDMPEGRPIWKTLPLRVAITAVLVVLLAVGAVAVVFTGNLAEQAGRLLLVGVVMIVMALLYWSAPNVRHPGFRWITPGSVLAVVVWIVVSAAFGFYVANFAAYGRTYAAMGGVIVFLIWLWLSNVAVLLGVQFDAELARERAIHAGGPPEREPYLEPRDTSRMDDDERP